MQLSLANRKGFTLPMTILVMTALAAALAAGFAGAASEYTTNAAERSQNRAYHLAETGLEQFLTLRSQTGWCQHCADPVTADSEWTRISFTKRLRRRRRGKGPAHHRLHRRDVLHSIEGRRQLDQAQRRRLRHRS